MQTRKILTVVLLAFFVGACSDDSDDPAGPPSDTSQPSVVEATPQITFNPGQVTVDLGETVTWEFGSVAHNVFFDDAAGTPDDIAGFNSNTSFSRTFDGAGTFGYECRIHPGMRGTIVVNAAGSSPGTTGGSGY